MAPNTSRKTRLLPTRERAPGLTPPPSGKHIDGCDRIGGFHDGLYELFNSTKRDSTTNITVPSEKDLATVLEQDDSIAAAKSDAARIIEDCRAKIDELNAQFNDDRARKRQRRSEDLEAVDTKDCIGSALLNPSSVLVQMLQEKQQSDDGDATVPIDPSGASCCPGCMHASTTEPLYEERYALAKGDGDGRYSWFTRSKEKVVLIARKVFGKA
ncbi:hypothetical protein SLS59_008581 [Nothophoma quercina]|uniref:Uncharacterized protein n=1 Tax=Nothophoma quercina TaxID=749835 RepID=A0ABR3QRZ7_9PLEO